MTFVSPPESNLETSRCDNAEPPPPLRRRRPWPPIHKRVRRTYHLQVYTKLEKLQAKNDDGHPFPAWRAAKLPAMRCPAAAADKPARQLSRTKKCIYKGKNACNNWIQKNRIHISKTSVHNMMDFFQRHNYIHKEPKQEIFLTEHGRNMAAEYEACSFGPEQ